jgi:peptide maturation system protein (TIGR04066 family)
MLLESYLDSTIVYPYGNEFAPILNGLLKQKRVDQTIKLIAPLGWSINGLDAGEAFGRPSLGINISTGDFHNEIKGCKTFIVAPYEVCENTDVNISLKNTIDDNIQLAKSLSVNIIDLRMPQKGLKIKKLNKSSDRFVNEIQAPIIFVNGVMDNVNKLDVLFELGYSLTHRGYKVSQIGTRLYSNILGIHPFPKFMFSAKHESEKINGFKSYVQYIYDQEKPDLLLIGIPGASIPFNDDIANGYGIIHFLVSLAFHADFSVTCISYQYWDIPKLHTLYANRFGHGIDCVIASNLKTTYSPSEFPNKLLKEKLDYKRINDFINNHPRHDSIPIYNIFNSDDVDRISDYLVDQLGEIKCFTV